MRWQDLASLALTGLWQRRLRTALGVLGVAVGCFLLATSLAVGQGVQHAVESQLRRQDRLRRIVTWPGKGPASKAPTFEAPGEMSDVRRERLLEAMKLRWKAPESAASRGISPALEAEIAELPHVREVRPSLLWNSKLMLEGKSADGVVLVGSGADAGLARRLLVSDRPEEEGVLVSEHLAYLWGYRDEADVPSLLGRTMRMEAATTGPGLSALLLALGVSLPTLDARQAAVLEKAARQLPKLMAKIELPPEETAILLEVLKEAQPAKASTVTLELPIRGVFRDTAKGELSPWDSGVFVVDAYIPPASARRLFLSRPGRTTSDLPQAVVLVDREENVREVQDAIKEMGLEVFSLADLVDQVRFNLQLIITACGLLAAIALLVAVLGIVNTMLMAVLQRSHEIGVLKALGARDGQVLAIFLIEGAVQGLLGSLLGLLAAWLASYPGDALARWIVAVQSPMRLEESVFAYPWWLLTGVPLGVTLVTVIACAYPARRAARIDPIDALRER
jgi:putative ABC transport system permease protein